jgi:tetratricopeptide (TPR) repeat protein
MSIKERSDLLQTAYGLLNDDTKIEEGMQCVDKLLKMNPHNREALIYKGIALSRMDKNNEALLCLNHVIKLFPRHYNGYMNKGTVLFNLQRYQSALDAFNKSIDLTPDDDDQHCDLYFNQGNCLFSLNRFEEAFKSFKQAASLDTSDRVFLVKKGHCLRELKRFKEAIVEYKAALRIEPETQECYFHIGNILKDEMKDYAEAIKYFNKLIIIDPTNSCPLLSKADCLMACEKWAKASQFYQKAFDLIACSVDQGGVVCCNSHFDIDFNLSICFYNMNKNEQALVCINRCIQMEANKIDLYVHKRRILVALKKYDEAADCEIEELRLQMKK